MVERGFCQCCGKPIVQYMNYCDWDCHIKQAIKNGGKIHTPNGLPIKAINRDGTMLEHEHGDHPHYKFPVTIEYIGKTDPKEKFGLVYTAPGVIEPMDADFIDKYVESAQKEVHALIYSDGIVAITLYECCYAMWYLNHGSLAYSSLHEKDEWKICDESLKKIRSLES